MRPFTLFFLLSLSGLACADLVAFGCRIKLPQCYHFDTKYQQENGTRFQCTEPIDNPWGVVSYHSGNDPRSNYTLKITNELLYVVDGISVEKATFSDEQRTLNVEYIYLTKDGNVLALGGAATELLDEIIENCLNHPVPK